MLFFFVGHYLHEQKLLISKGQSGSLMLLFQHKKEEEWETGLWMFYGPDEN